MAFIGLQLQRVRPPLINTTSTVETLILMVDCAIKVWLSVSYRMHTKAALAFSTNQPSEGKLSGADFSSISFGEISVFCFRSLIFLITLARSAHSTKKATTATAQMINSVNASLNIILMLINLIAKIQK